MPRLFLHSLTSLIVVVLLAGCQALEIKEQQNSLDKVLHAYETAMRWSYIHQAYSLIKPELLKDIEIPQGLKNIKVTKYEIIEPAVINSIKSNIARQVVFISYVERDRQKEKTLTDHQLWEYDKSAGRWYLISEIPAFITIPTIPKMRALPLDQ